MHLPTSWSLLAPMLLASSASARFVMYADQWHTSRPTDPKVRAGIDHVILAFSGANNTATYEPYVPMATIRSEYPGAKVMIAVGGWGDDAGFDAASRTDASIRKFAADIKTMMDNTGADGVDLDWEFPGGNGADYKQVPNSERTYQIEAFPKVVAATREAIGKDKLLTLAVPGRKGDMIGYTKETGPKIWEYVDQINLMAYDYMNRRDRFTKHHTSLADSAATVEAYLAIGAPAAKMNLGFAYYAKWFTTEGDCGSNPLNCPIVLAEDPITGADTGKSGAWTFETANMAPVNTSSLAISTDATCGAAKGTRCENSCCSQFGNCGTTTEHCSGACQHAFGIGCTDTDIAGSWQKAARSGVTDQKEGGQYYFDAANRLFWTWDTPALISRKFEQVVDHYKLGGVMAWSLGEDTYDWSHVRRMGEEVAKRAAKRDTRPIAAARPRPARPAGYTAAGVNVKAPAVHAAATIKTPYVDPTADPNYDSSNAPDFVSDPRLPYDVVWVDAKPAPPAKNLASYPATTEGRGKPAVRRVTKRRV